MKWVLYLQVKGYEMWFAIYRSSWPSPGNDSENKLTPCGSSFIEVDRSQATHLGAGGKSFGFRANALKVPKPGSNTKYNKRKGRQK
jgi:hypothetical protein